MKEVDRFVGNVFFKRVKRKHASSKNSREKVHRRRLYQLKTGSFEGDKNFPDAVVPASGIAHKNNQKNKRCMQQQLLDADVESTNKADSLQDLNDIFSSLKSKQTSDIPKVNKESSQLLTSRDQSYGLVQSAGGARSSIISPNPPVHRFDQSTGLPVYKYTALLVGDGGGTPLCPFDCECCF